MRLSDGRHQLTIEGVPVIVPGRWYTGYTAEQREAVRTHVADLKSRVPGLRTVTVYRLSPGRATFDQPRWRVVGHHSIAHTLAGLR
jgi:hypothetical protein